MTLHEAHIRTTSKQISQSYAALASSIRELSHTPYRLQKGKGRVREGPHVGTVVPLHRTSTALPGQTKVIPGQTAIFYCCSPRFPQFPSRKTRSGPPRSLALGMRQPWLSGPQTRLPRLVRLRNFTPRPPSLLRKLPHDLHHSPGPLLPIRDRR